MKTCRSAATKDMPEPNKGDSMRSREDGGADWFRGLILGKHGVTVRSCDGHVIRLCRVRLRKEKYGSPHPRSTVA